MKEISLRKAKNWFLNYLQNLHFLETAQRSGFELGTENFRPSGDSSSLDCSRLHLGTTEHSANLEFKRQSSRSLQVSGSNLTLSLHSTKTISSVFSASSSIKPQSTQKILLANKSCGNYSLAGGRRRH